MRSNSLKAVCLVVILLVGIAIMAFLTSCNDQELARMNAQGAQSAQPVSFGPDLEARKQNTPALFEALNRYARADKAFRAEFGTYRGPQDVNYERLKPLLDELRDSVADVNERLKNFDSLTARSTGNETQQVSSNRLLE